MNNRQALLDLIRKYPGGWDAMAAAVGMSRDALENRIYERKGQQISLHVATQMESFSDCDALVSAHAAARGGVFMKLPAPGDMGNEEISDLFHRIWQDMGELSNEYIELSQKGEATADDQRKLNRVIQEMHVLCERLKSQMMRVYVHDDGSMK